MTGVRGTGLFVQAYCRVHRGYVRTVPGSFLDRFGVCSMCAPREKEYQ